MHIGRTLSTDTMKQSCRAIAAQVVMSTLKATSSSSKRKAAMASAANIRTRSPSCRDDQHQQMQHLRHQRHPYHTVNTHGTKSVDDNTAIIITPPPSPQLLLEGDEMYISSDGKSHTYYQLQHSYGDYTSMTYEYLLEEAYDIENARKDITLFQSPLNSNKNGEEQKKSSISTRATAGEEQLSKIFSFPLQEISNGMQKGAGTGSMTWESSIVMGLYFGMYPDELVGNVLELGSGVGLGGILTSVVAKNETSTGSCRRCRDDVRFTLTEVNRDIIDMLRYNTNIAAATNRSSGLLQNDEFQIEQMDWFDFLIGTKAQKQRSKKYTHTKKYDTIIASDCIYLHSQIRPLSDTITELLGHSSPNQKVHIFSPHNRSFVQDLIENLREEKGMNVHVDTIELSKMRVKSNEEADDIVSIPSLRWLSGEDSKIERQANVSNSSSRFLHITASFKNDQVGKRDDDESMTGID